MPKTINFYDDYFNIRLIWPASLGEKAPKKRKFNRFTNDGEQIPKNIFKIGDKEKYKTFVERQIGDKKDREYIGTFNSVDEALEAQSIWKSIYGKRRSRIDL